MHTSCPRFVAVALAMFGAITAHAQTTFYVNGTCGNDDWTGTSDICEQPNGPKATIQAGINAADNGDTVIVMEGVYTGEGNKNLDFFTKEMTIRGQAGAANTIIDCEDDGVGIKFGYHGQHRPVTIDSLTIRNGRAELAGGILIIGAEVTIDNCIIENCVSTGQEGANSAGGLCIIGSPVTILRTVIRENTSLHVAGLGGAAGGGIGIYFDSDVTIEDCRIERNQVGSIEQPLKPALGGGVYANLLWTAGSLHMNRCVVADNVAIGARAQFTTGGGMYVYSRHDNKTIIENCEIRGNQTNPGTDDPGSRGGGATIGGYVVMRDCVVADNEASLGGGIYLTTSGEGLIDTLVTGNYARMDGGGVYGPGSDVRNVRIIGNTAGRDGGGACTRYTGNVWTDCLITDNIAARNGGAICSEDYLEAQRLILLRNRAGQDGGGVFAPYGTEISDALIARNDAAGRGGGVFVIEASDSMRNCTVVFNRAGAGGGGVHVQDVGFTQAYTIHSSILRDNHPVAIVDESGFLKVNRSNVESGWPGTGNIDTDPRFRNPANDDFRLTAGSACIDSGRTDLDTSIFDLAGHSRNVDDPGMPDAGIPAGPLADMGCYEFQGTSTGFITVHPRPGIAGQSNQFQAAGATPGNRVYFVYGFQTGSTQVPGCNGVNIDIANPRIAASANADNTGYASSIINVPNSAANRSILLQAVDQSACDVSNVVRYRFPMLP